MEATCEKEVTLFEIGVNDEKDFDRPRKGSRIVCDCHGLMNLLPRIRMANFNKGLGASSRRIAIRGPELRPGTGFSFHLISHP